MSGEIFKLDGMDTPTPKLVIDRPERRNALTEEMWLRLGEILNELGQRADIRALVIAGSNGHFCAGADLSEASRRQRSFTPSQFRNSLESTVAAVRNFPRPTIALLEGAAMGGGCSLALACDFRIAKPDLRIGIPAARIGLVYGIEDTRRLVNLAGSATARRLLYTGELLEAGDAHRLGLVDSVTDDPHAEAVSLSKRMASMAPLSVAGAKLCIDAIVEGRVPELRERLVESQTHAETSNDYLEGTRAFAERRPPQFRGD